MTTAETEIYLWDVQKKEMKPLHRRARPPTTRRRTSIPTSKRLYYLTNDGGEFARVRRYDLASGTHEDVEKADWDVIYTSFSPRRPLSRHRRQRGRRAP